MAESLLLAAQRVQEDRLGINHERTQATLGRLVTLYESLGRSAKAAEYSNKYYGPNFGLASGTFPLDQARGKSVRYSAVGTI